MSLDSAAVLEKAKDIVSTPDRWCRRDWAETIEGGKISPFSTKAVRWCAYGAIACAGRRIGKEYILDASIDIFNSVSEKDVISLNDDPGTTHDMLMETFDRAIAKARGS